MHKIKKGLEVRIRGKNYIFNVGDVLVMKQSRPPRKDAEHGMLYTLNITNITRKFKVSEVKIPGDVGKQIFDKQKPGFRNKFFHNLIGL